MGLEVEGEAGGCLVASRHVFTVLSAHLQLGQVHVLRLGQFWLSQTLATVVRSGLPRDTKPGGLVEDAFIIIRAELNTWDEKLNVQSYTA